jgi:HIV Tat-specific factor 1
VEELEAHFKRGGIIKQEYSTGAPKIKLYRDAQGRAKGDATLCYLQHPSVELAVTLLDGAPLRPSPMLPPEKCFCLAVQPAVFDGAREGDPRGVVGDAGERAAGARQGTGRGGKGGKGGGASDSSTAAAAAIRAAGQKALLSWTEGDEGFVALGEHGSGAGEPLKIVVFENLYAKEEAEVPGFLDDFELDFMPEVERACGALQKVTFFPGGQAVIKFKTCASATSAINLFNGRSFGGRKVAVQFWTGQDLREGEGDDEDQESERLAAFGAWLESK